ncbi:hypothetical protein [Bacillus atrophaeus]|uniref:hypothetical protein n=1 Tax=Bacillus atrophaeus TaxID=1452 RepID=UPI001C633D1D|nr:hypothetical protein [Bacillus atrophaeus]QYG88332.1 hypothetical protein HCU65_07515 [Bacillus atrophaeus]
MTLKIRTLWPETPALSPQQETQLLDLYARPITAFDDAGRAYQIGFNTVLTYFGYLVENETDENGGDRI